MTVHIFLPIYFLGYRFLFHEMTLLIKKNIFQFIWLFSDSISCLYISQLFFF